MLPLTCLQLDATVGAEDGSGKVSAQALAGECAGSVIEGSPVLSQAAKPYCEIYEASLGLKEIHGRGA